MKRAHVFVSGLVQGVFFRASTRDKARELGLSGWVRNLHDGRVEAVFEGDDKAVGQMLQWCTHGPESAEVQSLDTDWEEPSGEFKGFNILY
jgi:acylphosphatase